MALTKLAFTHGIEMELQVVRNDGHWIDGKNMPEFFRRIVDYCFNCFSKGKFNVPSYINKKIKRVWVDTKNKRGEVLVIDYTLASESGSKETLPVEAVGKDGHGSGVTWILEIVTPPCEYLEELDWWCHILFRAVHEAVSSLPGGLHLISTGLNPLEKFSTGISFGDHHHIGVPGLALRFAVYNYLRNFLPHLIALTVNSPFVDGKMPPLNETMMKAGKYILADQTAPMSIRLLENTNQLGPPNAMHYLPYLHFGADLQFFQKKVQRYPDERVKMVDMFPFTRFGTIELRVFDAQLSTRQRIAIALLIQAMALRARKLFQARRRIVSPTTKDDLVQNRAWAILRGPLIGMATRGSLLVEPDMNLPEPERGSSPDPHQDIIKTWQAYTADPEFTRLYNEISIGKNTKLRHLIESCQNLFSLLQDEFRELNVLDTGHLDPLFMTLWGPREKQISPPVTPGHFQLYLASQMNGDLTKLIRALSVISDKVAARADYDPAIELWGKPAYPEFLMPVRVELQIKAPTELYAEMDAELNINLRNLGPAVKETVMEVDVSDSTGAIIFENEYTIGDIPANSIKDFPVKFRIGAPGTSYVASASLRNATKTLTETSWSGSAYTVTVVMTHIGSDTYILSEKDLNIPFVLTLQSTFKQPKRARAKVSLIDEATKKPIKTLEFESEIHSGVTTVILPEPLFGKSVDEISKLTAPELEALGPAGAILSVIQGLVVQPIDPLSVLPQTESCRAWLQAEVFDERGKLLHCSESPPFRVEKIGHGAPFIRVDMAPISPDGWLRSGQRVEMKCKALGTFSEPPQLTGSWWLGVEKQEATHWTPGRSGDETTLMVAAPRIPAGSFPASAKFIWNSPSGEVIGEGAAELRSIPEVELEIHKDGNVKWPLVCASYCLRPGMDPALKTRWTAGGIELLHQTRREDAESKDHERYVSELLFPPGLSVLALEADIGPIKMEIFQDDELLASASFPVPPLSGDHPVVDLKLIDAYLVGIERMSGVIGGTQRVKSSQVAPRLVAGVKGNLPLYHGAILKLKPGETLEYHVRLKWKSREIPAQDLCVVTRIQTIDGMTLSEDKKSHRMNSAIADVGPFCWKIPAGLTQEVKLISKVLIGEEQIYEKSYVMRPDTSEVQ